MREIKYGCIIEDVSFRIHSLIEKCKYNARPEMKERMYDILMDYMFADDQYEKCYAVMRAYKAMNFTNEELFRNVFYLIWGDYQANEEYGDWGTDAHKFKINVNEVD